MRNKIKVFLILLLCIPAVVYALKVNDIWTGFQAGELSSYMDGQVGLEEYKFGAKTLTNFIPRVQGPASNRSGFKYVATARNDIIVIANSLKANINAHASDAVAHATADTINFPITTDDSDDIASAYSLIGDLLTAFDTHEADDDAGAGSYHQGQEGEDATLTSTTTPTTDTLASTLLIDLLSKYNTHDADNTANVPHTAANEHQDSSSNPNSNRKSRLIPFEFSTEQAYVLEFGDSYIRYCMNGGQINTVDSSTSLYLRTNGTDASTTFTDEGATVHTVTAAENAQIDTSQVKFGTGSGLFDGTGDYIATVDHADFNFTGDIFTIDAQVRTKLLSSTQVIYNHITDNNNLITISISTTGQLTLSVINGGSLQTLNSPINAISINQWHHIAVIGDGTNYYVAVDGVVTQAVITQSLQDFTGSIHIGIRSVTLLNGFNGNMDEIRVSKGIARWTANFTPNTVEYLVSEGTPYETTTTYTEAELPELQYVQSADTLFIVHPDHAPATLTRTGHTSWTLANISFTAAPASWGVGSYPAAVAFYEDRIWYAYFQTLWGSVSGDYTDMTVGAAAGDSMEYTIASNNVNEIKWLSSGKILVAGTSGGEYKISASSQEEAITPTNVRIVKQSSYGSAYTMPLTIKDVIIYVQRLGRKIREFSFKFETDSYVSPDLTMLAEHITESGINYLAYQQEPFSIVWGVRSDGDLVGMSYARENNTVAWHHHQTDGDFESIATIPSISGNEYEELWVIVKRTINGSTVRYIELLQPQFDHNDSIEDAFFIDSGLSYDGVSTSSISGLDHLEGETVSVLADGVVFDDATVSSGAITLKLATVTTDAVKVHAGLQYTSTLQTMRYAGNGEKGTLQGQEKRIPKIVLRTENAKSFQYGFTPSGTLKTKTFTSLTTGDTELIMPLGVNREGYVSIINSDPLPITVTAIIPEVNSSW